MKKYFGSFLPVWLLTGSLFLTTGSVFSQGATRNLILITTDGLRWQEVFGGMDTALANDARFNQDDSAYLYQRYWSNEEGERRRKLMPFLWSVVDRQGVLLGNRRSGSRADVANPYWFSYPGYSELFTGYADPAINSNSYPPNPHETVLDFFQKQPAFRGRVAAFGAWEPFNRILHEGRSGLPVIAGFDPTGGAKPSAREQFLNRLLKDSYRPWGEAECLDVFTHHAAMEWLRTRRPRVLFIGYGETDEWAHAGQYRSYLDAARQVDAWIAEIWDWVQRDPAYRNKTTLVITTDHGRGQKIREEWTSHHNRIEGAGEIWMAAIGPDTPVRGEWKSESQVYLQQLASTLATLMGLRFAPAHPVAEPVLFFLKMRK